MAYVFGEMLKVFRKRAELSQRELADALRCNRNTISNWESGRTLPRGSEDISALKEALALSSAERDELLNAARYPSRSDDQSSFENELMLIDKRREPTYQQPDGHVLTIGDTGTSLGFWVIRDEFTDCSVECQIRIKEDGGSADKWAGIRVRGLHTDLPDIGLGYLVYLRSSGSLELFKERQRLAGGDVKVVAGPKNEWTSIRCDVIGPRIRVWVNEQSHISVFDSRFGSGYVCLHTFFVQAEFRKIKIFYVKP